MENSADSVPIVFLHLLWLRASLLIQDTGDLLWLEVLVIRIRRGYVWYLCARTMLINISICAGTQLSAVCSIYHMRLALWCIRSLSVVILAAFLLWYSLPFCNNACCIFVLLDKTWLVSDLQSITICYWCVCSGAVVFAVTLCLATVYISSLVAEHIGMYRASCGYLITWNTLCSHIGWQIDNDLHGPLRK